MNVPLTLTLSPSDDREPMQQMGRGNCGDRRCFAGVIFRIFSLPSRVVRFLFRPFDEGEAVADHRLVIEERRVETMSLEVEHE